MAALISFSPKGVIQLKMEPSDVGPWVTPPDQVLDVGLYFRRVGLSLVALVLKGASTPSLTLQVETSMDAVNGPWFSRGAFATLTSTDLDSTHRADHQEFDTLLRYVRWKVTGHGDAIDIAFTLTGLAY